MHRQLGTPRTLLACFDEQESQLELLLLIPSGRELRTCGDAHIVEGAASRFARLASAAAQIRPNQQSSSARARYCWHAKPTAPRPAPPPASDPRDAHTAAIRTWQLSVADTTTD